MGLPFFNLARIRWSCLLVSAVIRIRRIYGIIEFIQQERHTSSQHRPQLAEMTDIHPARPFVHKCFLEFQRQHAAMLAVITVDPFGESPALELYVLPDIDK